MVGAPKLQHQASSITVDSLSLPISDRYDHKARLRRLVVTLRLWTMFLVIWANYLPTGNCTASVLYKRMGVLKLVTEFSILFTSTLVWDMQECGTATAPSVSLSTTSYSKLCPYSLSLSIMTQSLWKKLRILRLADDLCASLPYTLGLTEPHGVAGHSSTVSLKVEVKAATASFLCWPLTMASMVSEISERHYRYLRNRNWLLHNTASFCECTMNDDSRQMLQLYRKTIVQ